MKADTSVVNHLRSLQADIVSTVSRVNYKEYKQARESYATEAVKNFDTARHSSIGRYSADLV